MEKHHVKEHIKSLIHTLQNNQLDDGSWGYPFDTGISTDAYMIILLRTLGINDEELIIELTERILSKQEKNGSWKLFYDEDVGNVTPTVESYYALLYSGYYTKKDEQLRKAREYILAHGGIEKVHMFTKFMLALTGQTPQTNLPIPVEFILLPTSFPINFFDITSFGRANLAPLMILGANKFSKKTKRSPDLSDLYTSRSDDFFNWTETRESRSIISSIEQGIKSIIGLPQHIHSLAIQRAKQYMLDRIEPDGTLSNYFSATFLMIFALLSLGHSRKDPIIVKAVKGLKAMKWKINGHEHIQYTTANVWNTSLISFTLQKAGVSARDPVITKANEYLLSRQQNKYGDWAIRNPGIPPGGWGFSDMNTMDPDVDDTTASLRAISSLVQQDKQYQQSWDKGVYWVTSMQNSDGGWPAFERNVDKKILNLLPIEGARFLLTDPSSADLTGRTLEFLGFYTNLSKNTNMIEKGKEWLMNHQEKDGSWYGRWGICYIYGTWAAITGLMASGGDPTDAKIQKAIKWLRDIQNKDGGWGESCKSDKNREYTPLGASNITQTAWAVDALIAAHDKPTPEIQAGIAYLIEAIYKDDWTSDYPVGQGMGGAFYIHYHGYRYIFPLLALANYDSKY
ncbi:squalene--hopene cyclase [Lederbergia wuyishanensis]|uniref:Sporulenol synthase n=1 Tax=Lederbergia wuyishanensis TaxID=1347903 RepID=A0ABU0CZ23_9BACI|nr:squalene--hopene cyclase [Lederbergia wuyishanensis]MCJ8006039.1 squalene--hopene cyclase [Lederbergia wuyishanensis]MDQ0341407.1 sporulenol synthase [Lederbergia wuyishanensis]